MRRYRYVRPKGRQHRERGQWHIPVRRFSGYFKFVGKSGSQQLGRGGVLVGIVTHESGVVYTILRTQGFGVKPTFGYDAVHGRCGTRVESGNGRSAVGDIERIVSLAEYFPSLNSRLNPFSPYNDENASM